MLRQMEQQKFSSSKMKQDEYVPFDIAWKGLSCHFIPNETAVYLIKKQANSVKKQMVQWFSYYSTKNEMKKEYIGWYSRFSEQFKKQQQSVDVQNREPKSNEMQSVPP